MLRSRAKLKKPGFRGQLQRGQIVVEYVLLLMIGIVLAMIITRGLVSRSDQPQSRGFLITKWKLIIDRIAQDQADDTEQPQQNQ